MEGARYNAAADLVGRNLAAGRGGKIAFIDDEGRTSYAELARRAARFGNAMRHLGLHPEQRILLCLQDGIDFPTAFLGAIMTGVVPVAVNTLLSPEDYAFMLEDSRARAAIVSAPLADRIKAAAARLAPPHPEILVAGSAPGAPRSLAALLAQMPETAETAPTHPDEPCFWLYSSGSTGRPKGTVHIHSSLAATADLYGTPILGIAEDDIVFSAAKLFFAYGLGNSLTFPLAVGATAVLTAEWPSPAVVGRILRQYRPTIFYGVPTLYNALLASTELPAKEELALRRCASAGEPLPAEIGRRWRARTGTDILDGIGSTEMLHIFLSNRPGEVRYGTTGRPFPGYALKILGESGAPAARGEIGDLYVSGPSSAVGYWNNRERSRATFEGAWTRTGDKYRVDEAGYYVYCGRSDDMLKVSGQYVSPAEVEAALMEHESVSEAAVVGATDEAGLTKPKAFVTLRPGAAREPALAEALGAHLHARLPPFKCPRWFVFIDELPKTATGKIQRFKLREPGPVAHHPLSAPGGGEGRGEVGGVAAPTSPSPSRSLSSGHASRGPVGDGSPPSSP